MCTDYEGPSTEKKTEFDLRNKREMFGYVPHERVRPTDPAPVIIDYKDDWANREMRWGWDVPWQKVPLVNAKSETLLELPTFREHLDKRCLILAVTFTEGGAKFHRPGQIAFGLAGLWREEKDGTHRFVMLTTSPNESVAGYHSRMPFVLRDDQLHQWLCGNWQAVLAEPDKTPLEKTEKQPRLL